MIVKTIADAQQVAQYLQNSGANNIGAFADYTREQIFDMITDPMTVVAVRTPDGGLVATALDFVVGGHNKIIIVSLLLAGTTATRRTLLLELRAGGALSAGSQTLLAEYKGLLLDFCNEAAARGAGNLPVAWAPTTVGQMVTQLLGTANVRTYHDPDSGVDMFWYSANEAIAGGKLT